MQLELKYNVEDFGSLRSTHVRDVYRNVNRCLWWPFSCINLRKLISVCLGCVWRLIKFHSSGPPPDCRQFGLEGVTVQKSLAISTYISQSSISNRLYLNTETLSTQED